jgi:glucose-6-phosphate isomerase
VIQRIFAEDRVQYTAENKSSARMHSLPQTLPWRRLAAHAEHIRGTRLSELFEHDVRRASTLAAEACGLYLDFSKQRVNPETLRLLLSLAEQQGLKAWMGRLAAGEPVNNTEERAAGHMALRAPRGQAFLIAKEDVSPKVHAVLDRMATFAASVRNGQWRGFTGKPITDVVNIGIGGSDFGPRMVCEALQDVADGPRTHFVSNVDGAQISALLRQFDPATTLWIVTSKMFTTLETMANAHAARRWFLKSASEKDIPQHFVAVSTCPAEVARFGIAPENMFEFWDWVGGRYSLWSAVGLSAMIHLGPGRFADLLGGAHAMDRHFLNAPFERNLPVLLGLLGVWNTNFLDSPSQVIAPYAQRLEKFTGWLQQLEMESNGKGVTRDGRCVDYRTTSVLWGDVGTNSQHAYFQMLHQGPQVHPVDFILPLQADHGLDEQQRMLIASALAQSSALMKGRSADEVRKELIARGMSGEALEAAIPHRVFSGNRPSSTILMPRLDAFHLGALLALYEHRTFVQSVIWEINAFDQWGVELGKQLAQDVLKAMDGKPVAVDPSTAALLEHIRRQQSAV